MSGQREHREPPDVPRPNHHLRATWHIRTCIYIVHYYVYYYIIKLFIIHEIHETRQYTNGINAHTELLLILSLIY